MPESPGRIAVPGSTVNVTAKADDDKGKKVSELPFYSFEIYKYPYNTKSDLAFDEMDGINPLVLLRIPPSSLRISSPIRSEVSIDLMGDITTAIGGMGLRRWSISGSHGVGAGASAIRQDANGEITMADGYATRLALANFFETWATKNEALRKQGLPLLRMGFAVRRGTLTEFQNEEWWIQPDGLPEESRSIARPLDWSWSLSFIALGRYKDELQKSDGAAPLMPRTAKEVEDKAKDAVSKAEAIVDTAHRLRLRDVLANAIKIKDKLQTIRDNVSAAVSLYRNSVSGVAGYIRSCASLVDETLLLVNRSNLFDQPSREIYSSLMAIRYSLGYVKMFSDGYLEPFVPSAVRPPAATVQPGDTLQSLAAREFGDSSRWHELAELNGLTYPYLDFSGDGGSPATQFLGQGKRVLGIGDTLKLPNTSGVVAPDDPIGTDLTDDGLVGTLVGGVDNLRAALLRRIRTPRGYMPHHPEYGSSLQALIGKPMTPALVLSARAEVDRVLRSDPRVVSVQSIGVSVQSDSIWIEAAAMTVLGPVSLSGTVGGLTPA